MAENDGHRRKSARLKRSVEQKEVIVVEEGNGGSESLSEDENGSSESLFEVVDVEFATARLRKRWELASILNFFSVFEPVIGGDLKMPAEEIEVALIKPNDVLAKIHVALLKGIPPVSKSLLGQDAWVTALCKKLNMWWPWVAEGEVPLTAAKGEEIARYKKLDPTTRLMMLKALCEIRVDQDDLIAYINSTIKEGIQPFSFRKDKIGEEENMISYWYDGDMVIGHRLYKEINNSEPKSKVRGKSGVNLPVNSSQWETLATNLDEFRGILDEFSSSKVAAKAVVCRIVESDVVPVLEDLQKKKERALKRKQRQESRLLCHASMMTSVTRSSRARKPVTYTFEEYDQAIDEAIHIQMAKKKTPEEPNCKIHGKRRNLRSDGYLEEDAQHKDWSVDSTDEDEKPSIKMAENATKLVNSNSMKIRDMKMGDSEDGQSTYLETDKDNSGNNRKHGKFASWDTYHKSGGDARNRTKQRPTQNTAIEMSTGHDSSDQQTSSHGKWEHRGVPFSCSC